MTLNIPGKIIFSGEHAVVHDCPAIAAACAIFLRAEFTPLAAKKFIISSPQYNVNTAVTFEQAAHIYAENSEHYRLFNEGKLRAADILDNPVNLLVHALHIINRRYNLPHGGEITLFSAIPSGSGMGSSAAAVTAVTRLLVQQFDLPLRNEELFSIVHECENLQHGKSSGLDPATIINGGVIYYQNGAFTPVSMHSLQKFYLINTGKPESSTGECVSAVKKFFNENLKEQFTGITNNVYQGLKENNLKLIKEAVRKNHRLLKNIGVVPEKVCDFAREAEEKLNAAFKISGAGAIRGNGAGIALMFSEKNPRSLCEKYGYSLIETKLASNVETGEL